METACYHYKLPPDVYAAQRPAQMDALFVGLAARLKARAAALEGD